MAPLRSLALYGALCGLTAVTAAPAPVPAPVSAPAVVTLDRRLEIDLNLTQPTYAPPPANEGDWIACEFSDDDCGCTRVNGALKHYCGWVDPTWAADPSKGHWGRRLGETGGTTDDQINVDEDTADPNSDVEKNLDFGDIADDQFPADPGPDPDTPLGQWQNETADEPYRTRDLSVRALNNEIRLRRRHPMLAVLKILNFSFRKIVVDQLACITTKLPKEEQGQFVQGITGKFSDAIKVDDGNGFVHTFKKGATFALRWDVTGYDPAGIGQDDPFKGLHVNMLIEDGTTKQKWGIYQLGTSNFPAWPDFVGEYIRIRTWLTNIAGYYPAPNPYNAAWQGSENAGAQAIAKLWHNKQNPNDEL